ncbi:lipin, N-terminal conserved region-domain-containing protein [Chlamydoabsidia padenii]|nr:lipin, N-terminal conserved region-domain-containing protein [Chlamydoabsidia padenii]
MEYVGKLGSIFTSVSSFYNDINPATLSGAVDIVVVEQKDGDLACSPFHVRFGKLSLLMPQEKKVRNFLSHITNSLATLGYYNRLKSR